MYWSRVLFTDEFLFYLESDSRHVSIWREQNTRKKHVNIRERNHEMDNNTFDWPYKTFTNAEIYRDEDFDPYVKLFGSAIGNNFPLVKNNACPHCAATVTNYLQGEEIKPKEQAAYSLHLNSVEPACSVLWCRLA